MIQYLVLGQANKDSLWRYDFNPNMTHSSNNSSLDRKINLREINIKEIKEIEAEEADLNDSENAYVSIAAEKGIDHYIGDGYKQDKQNFSNSNIQDDEDEFDKRFEPTFKSPNGFTKTLFDDSQQNHYTLLSNDDVKRKSRRYVFEQRMKDLQEELKTDKSKTSPDRLQGTSDFMKSDELSKDLFNSRDLPLKVENEAIASMKHSHVQKQEIQYEESKTEFEQLEPNLENDKAMKEFLNMFDTNDTYDNRNEIESKFVLIIWK